MSCFKCAGGLDMQISWTKKKVLDATTNQFVERMVMSYKGICKKCGTHREVTEFEYKNYENHLKSLLHGGDSDFKTMFKN